MDGRVCLLQLPSEVLVRLCNFLDVDSLLTLSKTCAFFHHLLNTPHFWKLRLKSRWPFALPDEPGDMRTGDDVEDEAEENQAAYWRSRCVAREQALTAFSQPDKLHCTSFQNGMGMCTDVIKILPETNLVAVGARDRSFSLISLDKVYQEAEEKDCFVFNDVSVHTGWLWSVAGRGRTVLTGSFDQKIRQFDLNEVALSDTISLKSPVLSLEWLSDNLVAAGTFNKTVFLVDSRALSDASFPTLPRISFHSRSVLGIQRLDENKLLTASEDRRMAVFDIRGSLTQPLFAYTFALRSYARSLSLQDNTLWVGVHRGGVACYQWNEETTSLTELYRFQESSPDISEPQFQPDLDFDVHNILSTISLDANFGCIFVCRENRPMVCCHAVIPPAPISKWYEAMGVSFNGSTLVTGSKNGLIRIHWPHDESNM